MWVKCSLIVEATSESSRPARALVGQYDEVVRRSLRMIAELELAARGYRLYATFSFSDSFILTFRRIEDLFLFLFFSFSLLFRVPLLFGFLSQIRIVGCHLTPRPGVQLVPDGQVARRAASLAAAPSRTAR